MSSLNPLDLLREAVRHLPQLRFVWGIVGVVAAATIAVMLAGNDPRLAFVYFILAFAGVILIAVLASGDATMSGPRIFLTWCITVIFVVCLVMTLGAHACGCPNNWARLVGAAPTCGGSEEVAAGQAEKTAIKDARGWGNVPKTSVGAGPSPPVPASSTEPALLITAIKQPFELRDASDDCGIQRRRTQELCLPDGASVTSWSGPEYVSANCGSAIDRVRRVEGKPNCVAADIMLQGCGYDQVLLLRNCKGRGWVKGTIVVEGLN